MVLSLDISKLSTAEKLRLMAELWDSLDDGADFALSDDQLTEVDRRLRASEADPQTLVADAEMRRRLGWKV